ncbi:MAG: phosphatase PAP2 family protein [Promethearchaeota archaeon]
MIELENKWKKWNIPIDRKEYIHYLSFFLITSLILFFLGIFLNETNLDEILYASNPFVFWFVRIIAEFGSIAGILIAFCGIRLYVKPRIGRSALFAYGIAWIVTTFLKIIVRDLRPSQNIYQGRPLGLGWGFPSSISAGLVCFWGFVLFHAIKYPNLKVRKILNWMGWIFTILIPFSHIIIGMSDLEDIFGGYLIGFPILGFFLLFDAKLSKIYIQGLKIIIIGFILSVFYVGLGYITFSLIFPEYSQEIFESLTISSGIILGLTSIYAITINQKWSKFENFPIKRRNLIFFIQILLILVISIGFELLFPNIVMYGIIQGLIIVILSIISILPAIVLNFLERKGISTTSTELSSN